MIFAKQNKIKNKLLKKIISNDWKKDQIKPSVEVITRDKTNISACTMGYQG